MPGGSTMYCRGEKHNQPLIFLSGELSVGAPLPRHVFLYFVLYSFTICLQTLSFAKAHGHPPRPPSSEEDRRIVEPFLQGGRTAVRASDPREQALDLMGKEEDRGSPVSFPSSDPSAIPTSTATAPPRGRHREERW